jgi:galactitol-specific phosphotransferase system IIB component
MTGNTIVSLRGISDLPNAGMNLMVASRIEEVLREATIANASEKVDMIASMTETIDTMTETEIIVTSEIAEDSIENVIEGALAVTGITTEAAMIEGEEGVVVKVVEKVVEAAGDEAGEADEVEGGVGMMMVPHHSVAPVDLILLTGIAFEHCKPQCVICSCLCMHAWSMLGSGFYFPFRIGV